MGGVYVFVVYIDIITYNTEGELPNGNNNI